MTRFSLCTALAALTVLAVSPNADAQTSRTQSAHDRAAALAGAHNSITDENSIRQKCYEYANSEWRSSNQEMQTNRDYAYRTCAFSHGVRNP
jgi:predicted secreted protein